MYTKCKLQLTDWASQSIEILIDTIKGAAFQNLVSYWGGVKSDGGLGTQNRMLWFYQFSKRELLILDGGEGVGYGGGGLEYGQLAPVEPAAILEGALMTPRGIEPWATSGIGVGELKHPNELSVIPHAGKMTWRLTASLQAGTNKWDDLSSD